MSASLVGVLLSKTPHSSLSDFHFSPTSLFKYQTLLSLIFANLEFSFKPQVVWSGFFTWNDSCIHPACFRFHFLSDYP